MSKPENPHNLGDRIAVFVDSTAVFHPHPDFDPDYGVINDESEETYCVALPSREPDPGELLVLEVVWLGNPGTDVPTTLWRIVEDDDTH